MVAMALSAFDDKAEPPAADTLAAALGPADRAIRDLL